MNNNSVAWSRPLLNKQLSSRRVPLSPAYRGTSHVEGVAEALVAGSSSGNISNHAVRCEAKENTPNVGAPLCCALFGQGKPCPLYAVGSSLIGSAAYTSPYLRHRVLSFVPIPRVTDGE